MISRPSSDKIVTFTHVDTSTGVLSDAQAIAETDIESRVTLIKNIYPLWASGNTAFFERNYPVLLAVNGVIAGLLFILVLLLVRRLVKRLRAGRFGARMMMRFSIAFALMGVLPGALIYVVSTQFLARSIESWFDVRVDRALDSGLTLGRAVLDNIKDDVTRKARAWALELSDVPEAAQVSELNRLREQGGIQEALLLSPLFGEIRL